MENRKEIWILSIIFGGLLIMVCFMLNLAVQELSESNDIERQDQADSLRVEYERILLGCQTAGAISSEDPWLRELCDEYLPTIRAELNG